MQHNDDTAMLDACTVETPIGTLRVFARDGVLCLITFGDAEDLVKRRFGREPVTATDDPGGAASALRKYFGGDLGAIESLRVDTGGTVFQAKVWSALRAIPAGSTISYHELARRIDAPAAVRAVGAANGANPIAIVVPCHRVIGANGKLVGYGGGMHRKDWLLRHEGWRPLAP
jgi:methylated-DNA-[protein]-cysteine S-methyltransferase